MTERTTARPGSPDGPLWDSTAIPAATVVVLRDAADGIEVLMLRRDKDLAFAGGTWVFPGGRIDAEDLDPAEPSGPADPTGPAGPTDPAEPTDPIDVAALAPAALETAARRAAVREAAEEAGLTLEPASLHRWSHWTPPPQSPRRFTTAFFVAALDGASGQVVIDDGEIREHRWCSPEQMLQLRDQGHVSLTPPTVITLHQLRPFVDTTQVLARARSASAAQGPEHFATRIAIDGDRVVALYHGDAGYETGDHSAAGRRHRLVMGPTWTYERTP